LTVEAPWIKRESDFSTVPDVVPGRLSYLLRETVMDQRGRERFLVESMWTGGWH